VTVTIYIRDDTVDYFHNNVVVNRVCAKRIFLHSRGVSFLVCASGNNAVPLPQQCEYSIRPRIVTSIVKNK
jgi:hypothetical protein